MSFSPASLLHSRTAPSLRRLLFVAVIAILVTSWAFVPQQAHAGFWTCLNPFDSQACGQGIAESAAEWGDAAAGIISAPITAIWETLLRLIAAAVWWLTRLSSALFTFMLGYFSQEVGFISNPMVVAGWGVVRDIANWFFIVVLLVSAIATILNVQKYNARTILPRLLIIAILVNFSLFITGFMVNVSQSFMSLFTYEMAGRYGDIGQAFLNGTALAEFKAPDLDILDNLTDGLTGAIHELGQLVLLIMAMAIIGAVFAFIAFALLVRIIMLWVLMILSPLAFIAAVLPATRSQYTQWQERFIRWNIFGPIAAFFIWLGTWLLAFLGEMRDDTAFWENFETNRGFVAPIVSDIKDFMQFAVVVIFLYLSWSLSRKYAAEAAQTFDKITKTLVTGAAIVASAGVGAVAATRLGTAVASTAGKMGEGVANVPGLRGLSGPLRRIRTTNLARGDDVADEMRQARTDDERVAVLRRHGAYGVRLNGAHRALVEQGRDATTLFNQAFGEDKAREKLAWIGDLQRRHGLTPSVARSHLSDENEARRLRPNDAVNIPTRDFVTAAQPGDSEERRAFAAFVSTMRPQHMTAFMNALSEGRIDSEKMDALTAALEANADALAANPRMANFFSRENPTINAVFADTRVVDAVEAARQRHQQIPGQAQMELGEGEAA
jgi:hypothetical protein